MIAAPTCTVGPSRPGRGAAEQPEEHHHDLAEGDPQARSGRGGSPASRVWRAAITCGMPEPCEFGNTVRASSAASAKPAGVSTRAISGESAMRRRKPACAASARLGHQHGGEADADAAEQEQQPPAPERIGVHEARAQARDRAAVAEAGRHCRDRTRTGGARSRSASASAGAEVCAGRTGLSEERARREARPATVLRRAERLDGLHIGLGVELLERVLALVAHGAEDLALLPRGGRAGRRPRRRW